MSEQPNPNSSPEDNAWAQPENTSQWASASGSTGAGTSAGAGSSTGTESSDSNSWTERIEVASEQVIDTLKKLISEGNVRRVTLRKSNGKKLISVPMTAGAAIGGVAVLAAPMITAIAAVTALVTKVTLEIERTDDPENANSEGSDSIVQAEIVHDDPTDK